MTLAVAQGLYHAVFQRLNSHHLNSLGHYAAVILMQRAPEPGVRASAQTYKVLNGHVAQVSLLSQNHADSLCQLLVRVVLEVAAHYGDCALNRRQERRQGTQKGRFTGTVGAKQAGKFTSVYGSVDVTGNNCHVVLATVSRAQGLYLNGGLFHIIRQYLLYDDGTGPISLWVRLQVR